MFFFIFGLVDLDGFFSLMNEYILSHCIMYEKQNKKSGKEGNTFPQQ